MAPCDGHKVVHLPGEAGQSRFCGNITSEDSGSACAPVTWKAHMSYDSPNPDSQNVYTDSNFVWNSGFSASTSTPKLWEGLVLSAGQTASFDVIIQHGESVDSGMYEHSLVFTSSGDANFSGASFLLFKFIQQLSLLSFSQTLSILLVASKTHPNLPLVFGVHARRQSYWSMSIKGLIFFWGRGFFFHRGLTAQIRAPTFQPATDVHLDFVPPCQGLCCRGLTFSVYRNDVLIAEGLTEKMFVDKFRRAGRRDRYRIAATDSQGRTSPGPGEACDYSFIVEVEWPALLPFLLLLGGVVLFLCLVVLIVILSKTDCFIET